MKCKHYWMVKKYGLQYDHLHEVTKQVTLEISRRDDQQSVSPSRRCFLQTRPNYMWKRRLSMSMSRQTSEKETYRIAEGSAVHSTVSFSCRFVWHRHVSSRYSYRRSDPWLDPAGTWSRDKVVDQNLFADTRLDIFNCLGTLQFIDSSIYVKNFFDQRSRDESSMMTL